MERIAIEVTGELPLEIEGEELFSEENHWTNGRENNRYHTISLYKAVDEGSEYYALSIQYKTHWQGEHSISEAWELDDAETVSQALQEYNPLAHLVGFPSGDRYLEKQQRLETQIKRDWAELKTSALKALGIKRQPHRRGNPRHPLGACKNPGWSIPEQIRERVTAIAKAQDKSESEVVAIALVNILEGNGIRTEYDFSDSVRASEFLGGKNHEY